MTVRISEEQARLLFAKATRQTSKAPRRRLTKQERDSLPENQVKEQILGFLRAHRWVATRNQVGTYVPYRQWAELKEIGTNRGPVIPVQIGREGDTDWRFERPIGGRPGVVELFYLELKAPLKEPSDQQRLTIDRLVAGGFLVTWADGFDTGVHPFLGWYREHFQD